MPAQTLVMNDMAGDGSVIRASYANLDATNNVGSAIRFAQWADRSIHINGTFNGATVVWEGSNDGGVTYTTLTDPQGVALSYNSTVLKGVTEICELARPRTAGGGASQLLTVGVLLRRQNPMRT